MDETSVSLHPLLHRCWMKRGQRKLVPAPGTPQFVHLFGAYNWRTGEVLHQTCRRKNSEHFIEFIEHIMMSIPQHQKVVLVLDNASYHRSYASLAALALFEARLRVIWLPKYCPFLNPIERFWLHLKTLAATNHLHRDLDDLCLAIDQVIQRQAQPDSNQRIHFT
jgi:transposase